MSFKKAKAGRRKLMLFPLMDVFFILLIFFLAIAAIRFEKPGEENRTKSDYAFTPVEDNGETHILIQINPGNNSFTWLDSRSGNIIGQQGITAPDLTHPLDDLKDMAREFCDQAEKCSADLINIAVRCPNDLPYGTAWDIQKTLRQAIEGDSTMAATSRFTVNIALLPGSLNDILYQGQEGGSLHVGFAGQGGI
jgi:biopolymer transport protein ExbD